MLRIALTGGDGFLGWHVRVLTRALGWPAPVLVDRADLTDPAAVAARISGVDRVLHLAGVNRGDPAEVAAGNVWLAAQLAEGTPCRRAAGLHQLREFHPGRQRHPVRGRQGRRGDAARRGRPAP